MGRTLTAEEFDAISSDARLCRDDSAMDFSGTIVPEQVWFAILVRRVWPVKAAMAVAQYAKCPDRTARAYQSGDREPAASVLRDLIQGDEGDAVLRVMPRDNPPAWWAKHQSCERKAKLFDEFMERGEALNATS